MTTLTWRGLALMLFARSAFAVAAQALVAAVFALRSSPTPWHDAEPWLPVYGTLIDAGCLALLWRLTRREGIRLFDLVGFDRARLVRDVLLGLALVPASLVFILGGVYAVGWFLYGTLTPPYTFGPLPLPAALYGVLVFPFIWGLTEQMTYNGYLLPRFQVLCRSTPLAVALVAFVWSFQHVVMPLTLDAKFMAFRLLSPIPHTLFVMLVYLRLRRLVPLALAHALMDGTSVLIGVLLPLLRA
jgi:membrane protease YdiL (CAAX protease family)